MNFEIHITVDRCDVSHFISACNCIGVKPIVISTHNGENQVMTSSKHRGDDYLSTSISIVNKLRLLGFNVKRTKVEKQPELEKDTNFIYYETHFRLLLPKKYNTSDIDEVCLLNNFHKSKNLFKEDINFDYQMITYRDRSSSISEFNSVIDNMKCTLSSMGIAFDKVEIEECIMDTNEDIDKSWISEIT